MEYQETPAISKIRATVYFLHMNDAAPVSTVNVKLFLSFVLLVRNPDERTMNKLKCIPKIKYIVCNVLTCVAHFKFTVRSTCVTTYNS